MSSPSSSGISRLLGGIFRLSLPIAILALGFFAYSNWSVKPPEEREVRDKEQKIKTRVTELTSQDYTVEVISQGTVQSHNEITLSARVSGQIVALSPNIEVGAYFTEGEVLIELDNRDYATEVKAAEASLQSAQSGLKLAEVEHKRTMQGFKGSSFSVVTEAEVDQTAAALSRAEATLNQAAAALDQAKLDFERTKIKAPFDGRVRAKNIGLGQTINPGAIAATVFAVDYAEVRLPITARDQQFLNLPDFSDDTPVKVELRDSIQSESDVVWTGEIVRTEGALDPGSLELIAIARVYDPFGLKSGDPPLRVGQPVTASIQGQVLKDVVAIPRGAVRELDQIILVDKSTNLLTKTTITPLWSDDTTLYCVNSETYHNSFVATTHIVYAPEGAPVEIISDPATMKKPEPESDTST